MQNEPQKSNPILKVGDYIEYWMTAPFNSEIVWSTLERHYDYKYAVAKYENGMKVKCGPDMVADIVHEGNGATTIWLDLIVDIDFSRKEVILRQIAVEAIIGIVGKV